MTRRDPAPAGPGPRQTTAAPAPDDTPSSPPPDPAPSPMHTLRGIAVSPGIAIGPALVLDPLNPKLPHRAIAPGRVASELDRLDRALDSARCEAEAAEADARQGIGPQYADILSAHARMISDPTLRLGARQAVERDRVAVEHALHDILEGHAVRLEGLADSHLAARAADVRDILRRILAQLSGDRPSALEGLAGPSLVMARDLSPSETAGLDRARVPGFATEAGGRASHTAIVAEALEIPAVVGLGPFLDLARRSRMAIVDGDEGLVVLDPDEETLARYRTASAERNARFARLAELAPLPSVTRDGTPVMLWGNIEFAEEVAGCLDRGAAGVGLYRTDFLYMIGDRPPTEDEQYAAYEAVVRSLEGRPVTIRTLDLGADKVASYRLPSAGNRGHSALGVRSLRLSLREPELFRAQLRAILRAAALGDVRLMFPMVSTLSEWRQARALVRGVAAELAAEGVAHRADLPVGIMVEVPSAAVIADLLAKEVDFFSIGTNDLVQYTLAVDRTDETLVDLYSPVDPSVLRLIAGVVAAGEAAGIAVTVCGTMGGEPLYAMLLLGMGLRHLSMPPHQIPEIKRVIRGVDAVAAREVAAEALRLDTSAAVVALLREALQAALPEPGPDG